MLARIVIILVAPIAVVIAITSRIWREMKPIPSHVRADVLDEVAEMRLAWRAKSIDPDKWRHVP